MVLSAQDQKGTEEEARRCGARQPSGDLLLESASDGTSYPYWFDIVETKPGTEILATYTWHVTEAG